MERRISVRWNSGQQASCTFATLHQIVSRFANVVDVSTHGIGLVLPVKLEPGQELFVELPTKNPGNLAAKAARVVHVKKGNDGQWVLGCSFLEALTDEELQSLR